MVRMRPYLCKIVRVFFLKCNNSTLDDVDLPTDDAERVYILNPPHNEHCEMYFEMVTGADSDL